METTAMRQEATARPSPSPRAGWERPVRTTASRGGLGRSFVLSLALHGAAFGALVGFASGGGAPPRPVRLETRLETEVTLEDEVALVVAPPEETAPPAAEETLLEEVEVAEDPRLSDPTSPGPAVFPNIGIPGPGPGIAPRGARPPRKGTGSGTGAPAAPPAPVAAAVPEAPPEPPVFVSARRDPEHCPPPVYPARERERGIEGTVRLRVIVAADGTVAAVEVAASSGSAALDAAAVEAVRAWRFLPATEGGAPVPAVVLQPVSFGLVGGR